MNLEKNETQEVKKSYDFYDFIEMVVIAAGLVLLIFTLGIRLCRVDGSSMYPTLENDQMLLISDLGYSPKNGDVIVFHQSNNPNENLNKPLVKRVIAVGGQSVRLDYILNKNEEADTYHISMTVYVSDDAVFDESDILEEKKIDYTALDSSRVPNYINNSIDFYEQGITQTKTYTVPEGMLFVMGDNRYDSNDSRLEVGFVDEECVLGKVIVRLSPFGKVE